MALDTDDIQQLGDLFEQQNKNLLEYMDKRFEAQRADILADTRAMIREELAAQLQLIRDDIADVKKRLDRFFAMESEDVKVAYMDIEELNGLKKKIVQLEQRVAVLEK